MAKVLIATYSRSGRTQGVAEELAQLIDADMYKIEVAPDTFDRDMYKTDEIATAQIKNKQFPALVNPLPDVNQYDLILVGTLLKEYGDRSRTVVGSGRSHVSHAFHTVD